MLLYKLSSKIILFLIFKLASFSYFLTFSDKFNEIFLLISISSLLSILFINLFLLIEPLILFEKLNILFFCSSLFFTIKLSEEIFSILSIIKLT